MPSIKEYNRKIGSLKNTVKITKTMKMVSAAKLRRAQDAQRHASDYAGEVNELIYRLGGAVEPGSHPLLTSKLEPKKRLILLFTSDKGLCAGFNNNLIRFTDRNIATLESDEGREVLMSFAGRRGQMYFNSRRDTVQYYTDLESAKPTPAVARQIADDVCTGFTAGEFDEVFLYYNHFISPLSQTATIEKLLPMEGEDFAPPPGSKPVSSDFIAEPSKVELVDMLIPKLVNFKIFYALLENAAGEHGARMTAMDNATTNANGLIDEYTLKRNRARQAAITTELIEIIAGAEAL